MKVNRNPTSFSTTDQLCGKKPIFPTPTLRALLRSTLLSAWPLQRQLSQHAFTVAIFWVRGPTSHALRRSFATPPNSLFPQLKFASGPSSPQPQAATSKRIYRTRKELLAHVHSLARARIRH
jgi:hypothetical protein